MSKRDLLLMASILAVFRGEMAVRGVAERFGVTEAQVSRWCDIFEIAGMLALSRVLSGHSGGPRAQRGRGGRSQRSDPTTTPFLDDPNSWGDPTTQGPSTTGPVRNKFPSGAKARSRSKVKKRNKPAKSKSKR